MPAAPAAAQPTDDQLPDAAGVVGAYMQAREWTDAFSLPQPDEPSARVPIKNATGVCVILRRNGHMLGMGIDHQGDDLMLRRALGRALAQVWNDDVVQRLPESIRNQLGPELVIELDVAGPLIPLAGRTFADASRRLEPGLDGLAMRRGEQLEMRFPAQLLVNNLAGRIRTLLPGLATDMQLAAGSLDELRGRHGVSVYRFRTTRLAQQTPDAMPMEMFRQRVMRTTTPHSDRAHILTLATALQQHIISHHWSGDEPFGLMGDYHPTLDRYQPLIASAADQAFAAYALARFGSATIDVADDDLGLERLGPSADIMRQLAEQTAEESEPTEDLLACAMIVHTGLINDLALALGPTRTMFERAVQRLVDDWDSELGFSRTIPTDPNAANAGGGDAAQRRALPPAQQAVCAAALTRLAVAGNPVLRAAGISPDKVFDVLWANTPVEESMNLLPWIAMAGHDLETLGQEGPEVVTNHLDVLARSLVRSQWSSTEPDMLDQIGGFPISGGGGSMSFSAQSVRPMAFLAWWSTSDSAKDPASTLAGATRAVRFLEQLAVGADEGWYYPNIDRSFGGIRNSTWDATQPLAGQAMALIALCELLEALEGDNQG